MPYFTITADVNGCEIEWTYPDWQHTKRFWDAMKATRLTPDKNEPVFSAKLSRDGREIDQIEDAT